jgi:hypothetical protein
MGEVAVVHARGGVDDLLDVVRHHEVVGCCHSGFWLRVNG